MVTQEKQQETREATRAKVVSEAGFLVEGSAVLKKSGERREKREERKEGRKGEEGELLYRWTSAQALHDLARTHNMATNGR
mmetsp:Transcript_34192/g.50786  ORF Transcript_34192/g.50786 Transcript_34192/m.50786 type:complete len:81 (+) Transcript_34192:852-1094(+)